ncbi:MAG: hypothetical protein MZV70_62685 [Desulfobacterales bacterium]|nr:hypothetical protein [Desulfobacterales bacterium]
MIHVAGGAHAADQQSTLLASRTHAVTDACTQRWRQPATRTPLPNRAVPATSPWHYGLLLDGCRPTPSLRSGAPSWLA